MTVEQRDRRATLFRLADLAQTAAVVQECRGCASERHASRVGDGPWRQWIVDFGVLVAMAILAIRLSGLLNLSQPLWPPDRDVIYVTNAVKHFKWARDRRTTRRLHKTPSAGEVRACRPWLLAELSLIHPRAILCLGATASKAVFGPAFSVTKHRGTPLESELAPVAFATVHPSAVLRAPEGERRRRA